MRTTTCFGMEPNGTIGSIEGSWAIVVMTVRLQDGRNYSIFIGPSGTILKLWNHIF